MYLTKLKTFLKYNYGHILLLVLLLVISFLSFSKGSYLMSNDNYSPELDPMMTVERSLISPAWRTYRVLGFASESEQADVFRAGFFALFNLFLPSNVLGQLYYLFCLAVGSFFVAKLTERISKTYKDLHNHSQLIFLFTGITYISTLWTIWVFYQNMGPYITNFGFFPLLLYSIYNFIEFSSIKKAFFLFVSSLLYTATSVIATVFVANFVFLFFFILFFSIVNGKIIRSILKKILYTFVIMLTTQLFWILPFIFYTATVSQDIVGSFVNRSITTSVLDLETEMQTPLNSARLYSRILTDSDGEKLLFPMSEEYLFYDFYKVFSLIPAFLTLFLIPFSIIKKRYVLLFFPVLAIGSWFFVKVTNPPLGSVFSLFQEYIPLFKQVFRWPFSKLGNILLLSMSVASSFGLIYLLRFFSSFFEKKIVKKILFFVPIVIVITLQLLYAEFLFTGKIFSPISLLDFPNTYYKLEKYLEENDSKGRIYYFPPSNNSYFRQYNWGFRGSQFISYVIPNPVMDLSLAVGSHFGEDAMANITNVFRSGDQEGFLALMHKYGVKYILVDESVALDGFSFSIDWDISKNLLTGLNPVWQEDFLTLYEISTEEEKYYIEGIGSVPNSFDQEYGYFVREKGKLSSINPLIIDLEEISVEGNDIVGRFLHSGDTDIFTNTIVQADSRFLPTKIQKNGSLLNLTPSFPYIRSDGEKESPLRVFNLGREYEYFVVGQRVFTNIEVSDGITLEDAYSSTSRISVLAEEDFKNQVDLTTLLSSSEGEDCSGINNLGYNVKVLDQGIASGVTLKGEGKLPCIHTDVPIPNNREFVVKIKINWESAPDTLPGFCLYSNIKGSCLNKERYTYSEMSFGELEYLITEKVQKGDELSLVLYSLNSKNEGSIDLTFRNVMLSWSNLNTTLAPTNEIFGDVKENLNLTKGETYEVHIPIIYGASSYSYDTLKDSYMLWQPNSEETEYQKVTWNDGMYHEVKDGFLNQSNNLFSTLPQSSYLIYVDAVNYSNIPSNICLFYSEESKCWYQDIFVDGQEYSRINFFESSSKFTNRLDVLFNSHSYLNVSANKLRSFVVMKVPSKWEGVEYSSGQRSIYIENEMKSAGKSAHSTTYKIAQEDIGYGNALVSIPQAYSDGWFAIARTSEGIKILSEENRILIDGWKQGWDISKFLIKSIYVFYWPNLLGYLGYLLIPVELGIIVLIVFKQKLHIKYGKK